MDRRDGVIDAAARLRYATELGNGIARYDAWIDLCNALDALDATLGPRNPAADIRTGAVKVNG